MSEKFVDTLVDLDMEASLKAALSEPYDNIYYEDARKGVEEAYLIPHKYTCIGNMRLHWATTHNYYHVYNRHQVLHDKHVEILKQIDDAYQEVFRRVAAVEKLYLERFKESRRESKN